MKLTPADLLKLLRPSDLLFTEHGNFRIKSKTDGEIELVLMSGAK